MCLPSSGWQTIEWSAPPRPSRHKRARVAVVSRGGREADVPGALCRRDWNYSQTIDNSTEGGSLQNSRAVINDVRQLMHVRCRY